MTPPSTGFAGLPSELFSAILDEVDPEDLQTTTLALIKAIPNGPISSHHLFRHIRLTRQNQPWLLHQRLGLNRTQTHEGTDSFIDPLWIKSFKWLGWAVDADVLNNLVQILPGVQDLHINVGTNFSPEHLEDLLRNARPKLQRLSLRFRPYFRQATYYQFLAGIYFDSFLDALSLWPENPFLTTLSIIQDPLPVFNLAEDAPAHALRPSMSFAQPIVFFSLDPITKLAKSPIARHVRHLRFRIPLRTIWNKISEPNAFPSVEILDLSTSPVHREQAAVAIVNGFPRLRHLIVDTSGFWGSSSEQNEWRTLGRAMAMAGVKRAREKERELKNLDEAEIHRLLEGARRRDSPTDSSNELPGDPSLEAHNMEVQTPQTDPTPSILKLAKFRILPSHPRLLTISSALALNEVHEGGPPDLALCAKVFHSGWLDGIARLREHRERAIAFGRSANVRVLRFGVDKIHDYSGGDRVEELVDVEDYGESDLSVDGLHAPPLLCFGCERDPSQQGSSPAPVPVPHKFGCGHAVGRERWMPELHTVPAGPDS